MSIPARPESPADLKSCCTAAYGGDAVAVLLGGSYHPGGLTLTRRLAGMLDLRPEQRVLDVASGLGSTARLLAIEVPESLCVIGGGAVGLELAQVFSRFGAEVTVLEAFERLLGGEEPESGRLVAEVLEREGMTVHTEAGIRNVSHDGRGFTVDTADGSVRAGRLLVSTGRRADLGSLGVEAIGLDPNARAIASPSPCSPTGPLRACSASSPATASATSSPRS